MMLEMKKEKKPVKVGKVRKWVTGKPRGGVVSWKDERGVDKQVRLGTFIRDHLLMGDDHIQSTWKAYKQAVKGRGKRYNPGSYSNVKYYFYMLKKLRLIKPVSVKKKPVLSMGQKVIAQPVVYHIVNSVSDAWNKPREYYDKKRLKMER